MGTYPLFDHGSRTIGGMMNKPKEMAQAPPHWAIYVLVPDINAAVERITANGGTIRNGPMEVPGGDWIPKRDGSPRRGFRAAREEAGVTAQDESSASSSAPTPTPATHAECRCSSRPSDPTGGVSYG